MTKSINFLRKKVSQEKLSQKSLFIVEIGSVVVLCIFSLIVIAIYSYSFILDKEKETLNQSVNQQRVKIGNLKSLEVKQIYLKNKLISLKGILANQKKSQMITEAVFALLPEGISISGFSVDEQGGVKFGATSENFLTMTQFFNNLEATKSIGELQIKKILISGPAYVYLKGYTFGVYILFEV